MRLLKEMPKWPIFKRKLKGAVVDWKLEYLNGSVYKDGSFKLDIPNGGITDLGKFLFP